MSDQVRKPRILIVDDSPENIRILGQALKNDYQVSFSISGDHALTIAMSENPPDLILLDIIMTGMNGYEVCRKLKENKISRDIPVIFITAMNHEEDEKLGLEIGAVDYITKPFNMSIVKARVRTHIKLKQLLDMLKDLSSIDGLTGIPNRRRFDEVLNDEWRRALREQHSISLVMIDIDCFKAYNDNYGHLAGDDSLRKVAKTLAETVQRPMDFVARYGGEEFTAILPRTNLEGVQHVAEKMRKNIESLNIPHEFSSVARYVTISVGACSLIPLTLMSPSHLIKNADNALYSAKYNGRNQSHCSDLNNEDLKILELAK